MYDTSSQLEDTCLKYCLFVIHETDVLMDNLFLHLECNSSCLCYVGDYVRIKSDLS